VRNLAVARRYAKALLLIGKEDGQAETYREELDGFCGSAFGKSALWNRRSPTPFMALSADRKARIGNGNGKAVSLSDLMKAFLLLIFEKGRVRIRKYISMTSIRGWRMSCKGSRSCDPGHRHGASIGYR
jgi:F-type H+-transporting ATPase subunit delta